jgi:putative peptide zinc metalloprotease protein
MGPDRYLGWLDAAIGRYLYSPWCVLATFALFFFEFSVFVSKWSTIAPDIALYYNFSNKGFWDMVQFWLLILVLGFIHESAHGLTCRHFGGHVHSMGLMFLFLAPCFFVDMTAIWINSSKIERIYTIIAGIWSEMVLCGLAMIVWVNTQTGQWLHDFAYQVILLSGLAVVVINLNPLIKLDGYY